MSFPCWSFCFEELLKLCLVVVDQVLLQFVHAVTVLSLNKHKHNYNEVVEHNFQNSLFEMTENKAKTKQLYVTLKGCRSSWKYVSRRRTHLSRHMRSS